MGEIGDLKDSLWALVSCPGWKHQYCPKKLVPGLLVDMSRRHPERTAPQIDPVDQGGIDMPGMIRIDRTWQETRIDTFSFQVPTWDFGAFLSQLRACPERVFEDGEKYYKLHGWRAVVLFTPEQRELVLREMEARWETVERQADDELVEIQRKLRKPSP